MEACSLYVQLVKVRGEKSCSGCGNATDELYLSGIEWCCGHCYRGLCFRCVEHAFALVSAMKAAQGEGKT